MTTPNPENLLDAQISEWRNYLRRRQAIHSVDIAELEDHLRQNIAGLMDVGLATDEAFLVAVKRMGALDALSREFAREHSERLWKQLVFPGAAKKPEEATGERTDAIVALCLAAAAAALVKFPALLGFAMDRDESVYLRNAGFFVLPLLTGYFAWKRKLNLPLTVGLAVAFLAALGIVNGYPFLKHGSTEALTALHMPLALWLAVGIAYAGDRWGQVAGRMDFIRFSGELVIYYALIALGGGVFSAFIAMIFRAIGMNPGALLGLWVVPCGSAGAVLIASRLVEAKQSVVENMAPVLTRIFTPLFAILLFSFLGTLIWTGRGIDIQREVILAFDALLALIVGLLVYSISARDPQSPVGLFDVLQVMLLLSALAVDAVMLAVIARRIGEFGFSPNRVSALGENLILLVNLAWSAVLYTRFLRGGVPFRAMEKWQTNYLHVYFAWAAAVAVVFPLLFRFA